MSNTIRFLEKIASYPVRSDRSAEGYAKAVAALAIDDSQRAALLARDRNELSRLLGKRSEMMLMIWAPSEDAPQDDESQPAELTIGN